MLWVCAVEERTFRAESSARAETPKESSWCAEMGERSQRSRNERVVVGDEVGEVAGVRQGELGGLVRS